jgi:hypothetical protein
MKTLIAIITCHTFGDRANAQRETWVKDVVGADVRFFLGSRPGALGPYEPKPDEVILEVDDGYKGLPAKVVAMARWAQDHGYSNVCKCDDDVYVRPERLLASGFERDEYIGRLRGASGHYPAPYASGFCYWLGPKALDIIAHAKLNGDVAEDRFVGNTLLAAGIECFADYRYVVTTSDVNARSSPEGPRKDNLLIASCEFETRETMQAAHREYLTKASEMPIGCTPRGVLGRVCILIKTFHRDGFLMKVLASVQKNLPECKMVIVDDGLESRYKITVYAHLRARGHACVWMPYDSGFGAKSNTGVRHCDRKYVLIASDDFNFGAPDVREGIEKLVTVLDNRPDIAIASGRVNGRPYEACLRLEGDECFETAGYSGDDKVGDIPFKHCDLTVNYSLIRTSILGPDGVHWDGGEVKIGGGEHGAFFIDVKRAGHKVAFVPGVNISEFVYDQGLVDAIYPSMRQRARQPGRPCLRSRGIRRYHLMGGQVEEC